MEDRFTISYGGEKHELFMSYANLLKIITAIGDDIPMQYIASVEAVIKILTGQESIPEDIGPSDGEKLTNWVGEHVMHFFLQKAKVLSPKLKEVEKLAPGLLSQAGLET